MIFGTIFEMLGAITVGARTADTIKNGIIPNSAFQGNASVQMLVCRLPHLVLNGSIVGL